MKKTYSIALEDVLFSCSYDEKKNLKKMFCIKNWNNKYIEDWNYVFKNALVKS